jgi:hypothetical protein
VVVHAEQAAHGLAVLLRRRGHHAVDHRAGEARVRLQPRRQRRALAGREAVAEVVDEAAQDLAVARHVVAGDDRDPAGLAAGHAVLQPAREHPDGGPRRPAGEVGAHRIVVHQAPAGAAGVAALRDREGDDVDLRIGERVGRLAAGTTRAPARRPPRGPPRGHVRRPCRAALRPERLDGRAAVRGDPADAHGPGSASSGPHRVHGLVRAREGADAEMDDADGRPLVQRRAGGRDGRRGQAGGGPGHPAARYRRR